MTGGSKFVSNKYVTVMYVRMNRSVKLYSMHLIPTGDAEGHNTIAVITEITKRLCLHFLPFRTATVAFVVSCYYWEGTALIDRLGRRRTTLQGADKWVGFRPADERCLFVARGNGISLAGSSSISSGKKVTQQRRALPQRQALPGCCRCSHRRRREPCHFFRALLRQPVPVSSIESPA